MIIIHGDDNRRSYEQLTELMESYKERGFTILSHQASELDTTGLEQKLIPADLFGQQNLLVINGLFSGPKTKNKDSLKNSLKFHQDKQIIIYESKEVTANSLKPFTQAKKEVYKIPPAIFDFLESVVPGSSNSLDLFTLLLNEGTGPEFVFAMLVRQIRLLILAKSDPIEVKIHPFAKRKLFIQVQKFGINQLLDLHHRLYRIDRQLKLGLSPLSLEQQLIGFLSSL